MSHLYNFIAYLSEIYTVCFLFLSIGAPYRVINNVTIIHIPVGQYGHFRTALP